MSDALPPLRILETVLYYNDEDEDELARFYTNILGLKQIGRVDGRFQFYRVGTTVVLLFKTDAARTQKWPPAHGADGIVHTCFVTDDYEGRKSRLTNAGVELSKEAEWRDGGRSFYFSDPAGNLLEVGNKDFWAK